MEKMTFVKACMQEEFSRVKALAQQESQQQLDSIAGFSEPLSEKQRSIVTLMLQSAYLNGRVQAIEEMRG